MNIEAIFEIVIDALASVKWEEEPKNAFEYCFDCWEDVSYLEEFFEAHKTDLGDPFWKMKVEDAILKVLNEADQFKKDILFYAEEGTKSDTVYLDDYIFVPLSAYDHKNKRVPSKAYGHDGGSSMLRLYAIRLGPNQYIVTGGAIKLTKTMEEREHTKTELQKLKLVSDYLKANGIEDADDYGYLDFTTK